MFAGVNDNLDLLQIMANKSLSLLKSLKVRKMRVSVASNVPKVQIACHGNGTEMCFLTSLGSSITPRA